MIEYIFPTPIYSSKINNFENVQKEIGECIGKIDFKMRENWGKTHYLSDIYFSENVIDKYNLSYLREQINFHLGVYCSELETKSNYCVIESSWFSLFKESNYAHIHTHNYADISGVYYFKTDEHDGDLFFESPTPSFINSYCYSKYAESYEHKPYEGKILLFPGWLPHGVKVNQTNNTRISVAFNIVFDRIMR